MLFSQKASGSYAQPKQRSSLKIKEDLGHAKQTHFTRGGGDPQVTEQKNPRAKEQILAGGSGRHVLSKLNGQTANRPVCTEK